MTVFNNGDYVQVWCARIQRGEHNPFIGHGEYAIILDARFNGKVYCVYTQNGTKRRILAKNLRKA